MCGGGVRKKKRECVCGAVRRLATSHLDMVSVTHTHTHTQTPPHSSCPWDSQSGESRLCALLALFRISPFCLFVCLFFRCERGWSSASLVAPHLSRSLCRLRWSLCHHSTRITAMLRTILLLDGSAVMNSAADYLPSYCLALRTPILHCVAEYLDSTPLATMGVVVMRDGVSRRLSPCTSNGAEIAEALEREYFLEGGSGALSFENGLRMALSEIVDLRKVRAIATGGKPSHDPTRLRVLVISASVTLIDPADVFAVLKLMAQVHIEVHCVSLCGAVHVFEEAARMTGGTMHCPLNYGHLQSILRHLALQLAVEGRGHRIAREQTKRQRLLARKRARGNGEPRDESSDAREGTEMIPIGFPLYVAATTPARDVVVKEEVPPKGAPPSATPETATTKNAAVYMLCPQCHLIQTAVPTTCRLCRLQLCSVPVLYSSFVRHSPFAVLAPTEAASGHRGCRRCSTCQRAVASSSVAEEGPVKTTSDEVGHDGAATTKGPVQCSACACWRCAECDVFVKEQLGLCPTCLASL